MLFWAFWSKRSMTLYNLAPDESQKRLCYPHTVMVFLNPVHTGFIRLIIKNARIVPQAQNLRHDLACEFRMALYRDGFPRQNEALVCAHICLSKFLCALGRTENDVPVHLVDFLCIH